MRIRNPLIGKLSELFGFVKTGIQFGGGKMRYSWVKPSKSNERNKN